MVQKTPGHSFFKLKPNINNLGGQSLITLLTLSLTYTLASGSKEVGLEVNAKKTKIC
jgi:hypothetical protein